MMKFVRIADSTSAARFQFAGPRLGSDTARNLTAGRLSGEKDGTNVHSDETDVREITYTAYEKNMRIPVDRHRQIMYDLPVIDSGFISVGSKNRCAGRAPSINQHEHGVVLFPFLDEGGRVLVDGMKLIARRARRRRNIGIVDPVDPVQGDSEN